VSQTIIIATKNKHKVKEFKSIGKELGVKFITLEAFPDLKQAREDGKTFKDNAIKKAKHIAKKTGLVAIADDSGICIDALGGEPGVRSARYAGGKGDDANNSKVLRRLKGVPSKLRKAHYHCSIAIASPTKLIGVAEGQVRGRITEELTGTGGFGYDPLFYYPPFKKTFAQVPLKRKNTVSHRARALRKVVKILKKLD